MLLPQRQPNVLLNLIKYQRPDIGRIYLCIKDSFEPNYQLLIKEREKVRIKKLKNPKTFIEYLPATDDTYENLEDCDPTKKRKVLIVFDDMIANMEANKKLSPIFLELFLRGRKLNLFLYHNLISKYLKSAKSCGKNINLHSLMIKLLNAKTTVLKKDYGFDEVFNIFDEIGINYNKLNKPWSTNIIHRKNEMLEYLRNIGHQQIDNVFYSYCC